MEGILDENGKVIDKLFIKGVSSNRDKNDWNFDYFLIKNFENEGVRYYCHK
jgi:hypothetical protein